MKRACEQAAQARRPWSKPRFTELRLDLEVTGYVSTDEPRPEGHDLREAPGEHEPRIAADFDARSR
jgi:coenzyme PQQ precursor peptide PqqA